MDKICDFHHYGRKGGGEEGSKRGRLGGKEGKLTFIEHLLSDKSVSNVVSFTCPIFPEKIYYNHFLIENWVFGRVKSLF